MKIYKLLSITLVIYILIPFTVGCSFLKSTESMIPSLGYMKDYIKSNSKSSSNKLITLELKKGDKVKFTYDSNVKEGTLKIQLTRSKDEVIQDFRINKSGTKELIIGKDEKCLLSVNFDDFVGTYTIYTDKVK